MTTLVLALVLAAPPDDGVTLQWNAPTECPDAQAVRDEATRRSQGERRPVAASGTVRTEGEEWVLELTVGEEQRTIRATSCAALAEAAGLLIAVAGDPTLAEEPIEEPIEEPVVPIDLPPPVEEPPTEKTLPGPITPYTFDPGPKRRPRARLLLGVDAVGQFLRVLPAVAGFGVGGTIGVVWPEGRIEIRGRYYLPSSATDVPGAGGRIDLWTITPAGCWSPTLRGRIPLAFPICGGVELGGMRGRSFGVDERGDATAFFAAVVADASLVYRPILRLGLRLGPQVAIAARRPAFHLQGRDPLFESGPAALRVFAGIEVRLP